MNVAEIAGLFVIPAVVGAVAGWIYWRAAGRPNGSTKKQSDRPGAQF